MAVLRAFPLPHRVGDVPCMERWSTMMSVYRIWRRVFELAVCNPLDATSPSPSKDQLAVVAFVNHVGAG